MAILYNQYLFDTLTNIVFIGTFDDQLQDDNIRLATEQEIASLRLEKAVKEKLLVLNQSKYNDKNQKIIFCLEDGKEVLNGTSGNFTMDLVLASDTSIRVSVNGKTYTYTFAEHEYNAIKTFIQDLAINVGQKKNEIENTIKSFQTAEEVEVFDIDEAFNTINRTFTLTGIIS